MADPLSWALNKLKQINDTIWNTSLSEISRTKSFIIKQLRIIVVAARGFAKDKVELRASALTFYSLLSIIPIVAIAFAIAKGFGLDQNLEQLIVKELESQPEVLNWLLQQARNALQETRGGYIAGVGVIILFWSVISLLDQIEGSFNHIWQIRSSRVWYRKFTDYLTIMLIAPVFIILSSSVTVFVSTELNDFISNARMLDFFKPVVSFLVKLIPYILTGVALTILYIIMPNTKVRFVPAFVSGIIAGTVLQLLQWLYIDLQFGITKLSSIYGSFAAIPLFIIWLQASWIVLLLGAELAFANQNISRYEYESEALNVSNYQKRALVLMIMQLIIKNFVSGEKPLSAENIATSLKIPIRLVNDILQDLNNVKIISIVHDNEGKERLFQPATDINKLTVSYVLTKLDRKGTDQNVFIKSNNFEKIVNMLDKFDSLTAMSESNILIKDL
ncbi:MAG: YihY/virulence factor BrkB family protein [Bacteroidales bacterium]|nr:YihY/virulence factor BrkB family protein [Bacteroidales bacterium]